VSNRSFPIDTFLERAQLELRYGVGTGGDVGTGASVGAGIGVDGGGCVGTGGDVGRGATVGITIVGTETGVPGAEVGNGVMPDFTVGTGATVGEAGLATELF
jgi:hypothetical protein